MAKHLFLVLSYFRDLGLIGIEFNFIKHIKWFAYQPRITSYLTNNFFYFFIFFIFFLCYLYIFSTQSQSVNEINQLTQKCDRFSPTLPPKFPRKNHATVPHRSKSRDRRSNCNSSGVGILSSNKAPDRIESMNSISHRSS